MTTGSGRRACSTGRGADLGGRPVREHPHLRLDGRPAHLDHRHAGSHVHTLVRQHAEALLDRGFRGPAWSFVTTISGSSARSRSPRAPSSPRGGRTGSPTAGTTRRRASGATWSNVECRGARWSRRCATIGRTGGGGDDRGRSYKMTKPDASEHHGGRPLGDDHGVDVRGLRDADPGGGVHEGAAAGGAGLLRDDLQHQRDDGARGLRRLPRWQPDGLHLLRGAQPHGGAPPGDEHRDKPALGHRAQLALWRRSGSGPSTPIPSGATRPTRSTGVGTPPR